MFNSLSHIGKQERFNSLSQKERLQLFESYWEEVHKKRFNSMSPLTRVTFFESVFFFWHTAQFFESYFLIKFFFFFWDDNIRTSQKEVTSEASPLKGRQLSTRENQGSAPIRVTPQRQSECPRPHREGRQTHRVHEENDKVLQGRHDESTGWARVTQRPCGSAARTTKNMRAMLVCKGSATRSKTTAPTSTQNGEHNDKAQEAR